MPLIRISKDALLDDMFKHKQRLVWCGALSADLSRSKLIPLTPMGCPSVALSLTFLTNPYAPFPASLTTMKEFTSLAPVTAEYDLGSTSRTAASGTGKEVLPWFNL